MAALLVLAVGCGGSGAKGNSTPMFLEHAGTAFLQLNQSDEEIAAQQPSPAEIIDFTANGRELLYTDSLAGRLGFLDTASVSDPLASGTIDLPGDPTSVAVYKSWALVSTATNGDDFDDPTGELLVVSLKDRKIERSIELAGQPDAIAISPTGKYATIAIENERDEDQDGGFLPQDPPGVLQIVDLKGNPERWNVRDVDLSGLVGMFAADDPEPEFVDINDQDLAVVTLQENNHLAVVDLKSGKVVSHFSAGSTTVEFVDKTEEELGPQRKGLISLTETVEDRRREPDAVAWIDNDTFATANEGDYKDEFGVEGGSRSFTLFNIDGTVEYEAGNTFEHLIASIGHYPEGRSANKGNEPEGIEVGTFQNRTLLFVASERANAVGVYEMVDGQPEFVQVLPTGTGPEGLKFRNGVLAVSAEADGFDEDPKDRFGVRPIVTFFEMERIATPTYPYLISALDKGNNFNAPIPWVAQSALAGDPVDPDTLYSTSDSFLAQSYVYEIDISSHPAMIVDRIAVGGPDGAYDLEGIAAREEGGFWLASEGRVGSRPRPNAILRVNDDGTIVDTVTLPGSLVEEATSSGFEGVAVTGTKGDGDEMVYVVVQREWKDDAPGFVKVGRYEVATSRWTFVSYKLDAVESPAGGWVGLSEITALPDGTFAIVERDNQLGLEARVKRIYGIDPNDAEWKAHGEDLVVVDKTLLRDILADLDDASISVPDKVEGLGLTADGDVWLSTDNDGVDENYGETLLFSLGSLDEAFTN